MALGKLGARGGFGSLGALGSPPALATFKAAIASLPLDSLYLFAQSTAALANVDLVKPSRSLSITGSPTFTPNQGYAGDGVSAFLDTNYNPATNAVNFAQNSNSFGIWSRTKIADPSSGWDYGQTNYAIGPFGTSQRDYFTRDSSTTSNNFQFWPPAGNLYGANRTSSTGYAVFQNAARIPIGYASVSNSGNIATGKHGQGWCTDGVNYFTFEQDALRKRSRVDWSIISSNTSIFAGLSGTPNHCGDGDVYNGNLYAPVENYFGSCASPSSDLQIARYSTSTLALVDTTPITGPTEAGGLSIDPVAGIIYVVSFCDNTQIFRYSLSAGFPQLPSIPLNTRDFHFTGMQGISPLQNGMLWISCIDVGVVAPDRFIVGVDLSGTVQSVISVAETTAQLEGLSFNIDGTLGAMQDDGGVNQDVYFYNLPTDSSLSYTQASSAIPSQTFTVFKRNGAAAFTSNQLAAVFAGGGMTGAQWTALYSALYSYLRRVGAA